MNSFELGDLLVVRLVLGCQSISRHRLLLEIPDHIILALDSVGMTVVFGPAVGEVLPFEVGDLVILGFQRSEVPLVELGDLGGLEALSLSLFNKGITRSTVQTLATLFLFSRMQAFHLSNKGIHANSSSDQCVQP
jgi:hypothetical protein